MRQKSLYTHISDCYYASHFYLIHMFHINSQYYNISQANSSEQKNE